MSRRSRYARVHASSRAARGNSQRRDQAPSANGSADAPTSATSTPVRQDVAPPSEPIPREDEFSEVVIEERSTTEASRAHSNGHAAPANGTHAAPSPVNGHANGSTGSSGSAGCTAPQLRRFIKSRSYVPMHELRRRFGINGGEDDVTLLEMDGHNIFVGLPVREGRLLGELLRGGDVGYELSMDPLSPVVVGVYPMRPVPRA
jgi:hypothetical protein